MEGERATAAAHLIDLVEGQTTVITLPPTSVSVEHEFFVLPTGRAPKGDGYASDNNIPSLRYVTDSDSDFK